MKPQDFLRLQINSQTKPTDLSLWKDLGRNTILYQKEWVLFWEFGPLSFFTLISPHAKWKDWQLILKQKKVSALHGPLEQEGNSNKEKTPRSPVQHLELWTFTSRFLSKWEGGCRSCWLLPGKDLKCISWSKLWEIGPGDFWKLLYLVPYCHIYWGAGTKVMLTCLLSMCKARGLTTSTAETNKQMTRLICRTVSMCLGCLLWH